jgi:SHAQKYF class myb-like DNA-binding protein
MSHLGMGNNTQGEAKKKVSQRFIIQKFETHENFPLSVSAEMSQEQKFVKDNSQGVHFEVVSETGPLDRSWLNQKPREETENESVSPGSDHIQQYNTGRWTEIEHKKFLEAILMYGNEWKRVQQYISTRSSTQARSHAQKFFLRLKKSINISGVFDEEHIEFFKTLEENRKSKFKLIFRRRKS